VSDGTSDAADSGVRRDVHLEVAQEAVVAPPTSRSGRAVEEGRQEILAALAANGDGEIAFCGAERAVTSYPAKRGNPHAALTL